MIVGSMTKMHDNKIKFGMNAKEIIKYHTKNLTFQYVLIFLLDIKKIIDL